MKKVLSLVFILIILLSVTVFSACTKTEKNPDKDWTPFYSVTDGVKEEYLF